MSVIALVVTLCAGVVGAATCFRVPALRIATRRGWAVAQAILLVAAAALMYLDASGGTREWLAGTPWVRLGVVVGSLAAAAFGGSSITAAILELSRRSDARYRDTTPLYDPTRPASPGAARPEDPEQTSDLHGGLWIGVLERVAVGVVLLGGWATGLTVIAAVKALGRFAELKKADEIERFILGTLASYLWAAAWAGVAWMFLRGA